MSKLDPRIIKAWNKWMIGIGPAVEYLFLGGFLLSVVFYRKVSNQKLPMQVFLALAERRRSGRRMQVLDPSACDDAAGLMPGFVCRWRLPCDRMSTV